MMGRPLKIGSIVIHTPQFERTVAFWQAALDYLPREPASKDWVVLRDPSGRVRTYPFRRVNIALAAGAGFT